MINYILSIRIYVKEGIFYTDCMRWFKQYYRDINGIKIKDIPSPTKFTIEHIKDFIVYVCLIETMCV